MQIQRDTRSADGATARTKPRLNAAKKEEISEIMSRLRFLIGSQQDKTAHTVQIVFTSDKHESAITIS